MSAVRDLLSILTPAERRRVPFVAGLMFFLAMLEVLGVGGFLPLVTLASEPQRILETRSGQFLIRVTGSNDPTTVLFRFGSLLLILFVVKALLAALSNYVTYRFSYGVQVSVSRRILKQLLARDYEYFLGTNSAVLLKNVTSEVQTFTGGVLIPCLILLSQGLIVFAITILLALLSPTVALLVGLSVGSLCVLLFAIINRPLKAWGTTREQRLADLSRVAHQAISGIKVLKSMGGERRYIDDFEAHGASYANSNTWYQTAANTPTLLIELLVFGAGVGIVLYYTANGLSLAAVLPALAMFGAGAYRVLPAARLMFAMAVTVRYNWPALTVVREGLKPQRPSSETGPQKIAAFPILQRDIVLDRVTYRYPKAEQKALYEVSFVIPANKSVALVGSSGAGKTTVTDIILGLFEPSSGAVRVDGVALNRDNRRSWQEQLGYVPQQPFIADTSLRENVALSADRGMIDDALVLESLQRASLSAFFETLPDGLNTQLGENGVRLSGGERQRLAIARALYRRPRVLVLDEATSALDTLTERQINEELLRVKHDLTLVIVAHRLSTVQACDSLVMLAGGRVVATGRYGELVQNNEEFAAMDHQARLPGPPIAVGEGR